MKLDKRSIALISLSATLAHSYLWGVELAKAQQSVDFNAPAIELPSSQEFNAPAVVLPGSQSPGNYVLGAGDQIAIEVFGYEEFTGSRVVLPDGTMPFPFLGSIQAGGKTVDALSEEITQGLNAYLVNPVVNVSLTALRPVVVDVAGEVYRPGPVQLSSLTTAQTQLDVNARITAATTTPTLSSALVSAGGIRRTADIRSVVVRRRLPNGQAQEISVNLWNAISNGGQGDNLVLRDGDSIFVPRAQPGSEIDPALVASSSIAPDNVRVRVIGDGVVRPGEVQVQPNSSVAGAIAAAGGPNSDAALGEVRLVRLSETGQVEDQRVDLSSLVDNNQIQDGDVILVPKKGYLVGLDNINRALTPILAPLGGIFGILDIFNIFGND
ncbi:polysaccharide biosynthesis/export family protein [Nodosilinea sp. PGN35]|uniref:polysaccharide biosynthesis/export family protein n=1 Tax=Nodosilinea sp. PGN35 TaxID=3020489 RepID=UPI0023B2108F|nr:polysaccharide biosynthesis/export family protein [Nodosilinea sp. TSF1-S3]MDF0368727.1 polysaccharide export protein [Nodosilinea sp. TSF1-S3]